MHSLTEKKRLVLRVNLARDDEKDAKSMFQTMLPFFKVNFPSTSDVKNRYNCFFLKDFSVKIFFLRNMIVIMIWFDKTEFLLGICRSNKIKLHYFLNYDKIVS